MSTIDLPAPDYAAEPRIGFHVSAFGSSQVLAALSGLSRCGFQGLEIYADTSLIFADEPSEFRSILEITSIELGGVHGGGLLTDPEFREAEIAEWTRLIDWTAEAGGSYAIFYGGESQGTPEEDLDRAASFLNEIGAHAASRGIRLCYEPDRGSPFATSARVAALMDRTTPGHVWLSADTAHLTRMGLDPALFLLSQKSRVGVVHLRDLKPGYDPGNGVAESTSGESPFSEIGEGTIDLEGVAEMLQTVRFGGWIVGVVDRPSKNSMESAAGAAHFMREYLGLPF